LQTLLIAKREENLQQKRRYEVGLQKLASSSQQVAVMQAELTELMPKLMITVSICTIVGLVSLRWVSQEKRKKILLVLYVR
jgi:dynein heavy chain